MNLYTIVYDNNFLCFPAITVILWVGVYDSFFHGMYTIVFNCIQFIEEFMLPLSHTTPFPNPPFVDPPFVASTPLSAGKEDSALSDLSSRHLAIMRAIVLDGLPLGEVSERFEMTLSGLSILRSSTKWKRAEVELREDILRIQKAKISKLSDKAIFVLDSLVSDEKVKPEVKLNAAKDILDRTGLSSGNKVNGEGRGGVSINLFAPKWMNQEGTNQDGSITIDI